MEEVNLHPAPKPVTLWQCKLMASHLEIRRPAGAASFARVFSGIQPVMLAQMAAMRSGQPPETGRPARQAKPELPAKLRKVGRKPKPKARKGNGWAKGLSMRTRRRRTAISLRNQRVRALYRNGRPAQQLARMFGLSRRSIYAICQGVRKQRQLKAAAARALAATRGRTPAVKRPGKSKRALDHT